MAGHTFSESHVEANGTDLHPTQTVDSVLLPMSRATFEKLYLSPKTPIAGDLRRTFGNPTPIALIGFLAAATPNAMLHMGWRGAGGDGGAILAVFIFFGGIMQLLGGIGEWILGNTFSCAVFLTYGAFWLAQGASLMPIFGVGVNYSPTGDTLQGIESSSYHATAGLYYVVLGLVTLIFLVCSIRTNICFFLALFFLTMAFSFYAAVHFYIAVGDHEFAEKIEVVAGAFNFTLVIPVWYIMISQLLMSVDFPYLLPVGDLSRAVPGRMQRKRQMPHGEV